MTSEYTSSVMVVSQTDKAFEFIKGILPKNQFGPIIKATGAGEAQRILLSQSIDIVIINAPLKDEYGTELAINISEGSSTGLLMMVKADAYEQVCFKVENYGVLTLPKPCTNNDILHSLKLLVATQQRLRAMEKKAQSLEDKMNEIRLVNRAKGLVMQRLSFSENEAHKYIERQSMDRCCKKSTVALEIIEKYS